METLNHFTEELVGIVWGLPLVFLLFGAGFWFTLYYGFPQIRFFKHAIDVARGKYDNPEDAGEITHFQALCAALSATIGLGNIAGVAVAISAGGPGAVFWMWVAGAIGMATKFTSISLALFHREVRPDGSVRGGPMYTIKNGIGKTGIWKFLSSFYAVSIVLSCFGAGNMFQANQLADVLKVQTGIPTLVSGLIVAVIAGLVLIGGIKRIGNVASKLVPAMVVVYFLGAIGILFSHLDRLPDLFIHIFSDAFTGTAAFGGFAGIGFKEVVIQGVRRAVFSNEAGMGSAAIAHSAAKSNPVMEGVVGLLGPFIDTIVVCTLTALVLLSTGVWAETGGYTGSALTAYAFETIYGPAGGYIVTLTVVLFAFSTMISWSYYGEQGISFLVGDKGIMPFRYVFILFIIIGATWKLGPVLNLSDSVFALLAIPTLTSNIFLGKKLKLEARKYSEDLKTGRLNP